MERTDRTLVRVWAEVTVARERSPTDMDRPWTARLTAPGGEALLLRGAVTLALDSRTRWPAEVTYIQVSSGPHSPNWTEIQGTGLAITRPDAITGSHAERGDGPQPGTTGPGERRGTVLRPEPDPDHNEIPEHSNPKPYIGHAILGDPGYPRNRRVHPKIASPHGLSRTATQTAPGP
ncbi:hypothetical protein ACFRCI_47160 [Streptomyces sp. NPDC056638]|uniref:hypothetical protein n=1 Tax=Streptomyces sp. NPDC056638 TaxID=3345887 RepID=UPI0036A9D859